MRELMALAGSPKPPTRPIVSSPSPSDFVSRVFSFPFRFCTGGRVDEMDKLTLLGSYTMTARVDREVDHHMEPAEAEVHQQAVAPREVALALQAHT